MTLSELNLRDFLTIVLTPGEAVDRVDELHNDLSCTDGFALLILDIGEFQRDSLKKVVHSLKTRMD